MVRSAFKFLTAIVLFASLGLAQDKTETKLRNPRTLDGKIHGLIMTRSWSISGAVTQGGETFPGWKVPYNITITEISSYCDANTVTFNIEERAETTPNTAGTDALAADQVADTDQQEATSFSNATFAANTWMVPVVTSAGAVTIFTVTVRYTID